jgi:hypothetical protein
MELFGTMVPMIWVQVGGAVLGFAVICLGAFAYGWLTRGRA